MKTIFYPLSLQPVYQNYIWGGHGLREQLGRSDAPSGIVAESWEVTDRPDGMSIIRNGPLAGRSLRELIENDREGILGTGSDASHFPLLIKVLDAAQTLSVQVHPNDETAAKYGGEAKTEMWYVLAAKPGAVVYCGLREGVTPGAFESAIADNTLEQWMKTLPVRPGDAIFVPGGRVHAIGAGCLLLEVQQNSNTTYRIYDWGRVGADGKGRELHIGQAMQVSLWHDPETALTPSEALSPVPGATREKVMQSPYFRLEKWSLSGPVVLESDGKGFQVLFAVKGAFRVSANGESLEVSEGSSALLPAGLLRAELCGPGTEIMRITES